MRRLTRWFGMVAVLGLALGTGQAQAQVTVDLNVGNTTFPTSPPWEQITLTQIDANDVKFQWSTVTGSPATLNDVSWNGPTGDTITASNAPTNWGSPLPFTPSGGQADGFGSFRYQYGAQGNSGSVSDVTFTVHNTGGLTIAQLLNSFSTGGAGNGHANFAAHYFPNGGTSGTGWVASVPEPGPLLGAGVVTLMGLGYTWRRRRRSPA